MTRGSHFSNTPTMPLWSDLARATSAADGVFAGRTDSSLIDLLEYIRELDLMRYLPDGTPESITSSGLFERNCRGRFNLSSEQYSTITDIYDRCDVRLTPNVREAATVDRRPILGTDASPPRRRVFAADRTECCGRRLWVRWVSCTVYERDDI